MTTSLVALRAPQDRGKTTIFIKIRDFLRSCPEAKEKEGISQEFSVPAPDFVVMFEIAGVTLGLCSGGDYAKDIQENVKKLLVEHGCQIVLCATRKNDGGKTVITFEDLAKDHSASFTSIYPIDIPDLVGSEKEWKDYLKGQSANTVALLEEAKLFEKTVADIDALREVANETMLRYVIRMLKIEIKKQNPKAFSSKTCADL